MFEQNATYKLPSATNKYIMAKITFWITLISFPFFFVKDGGVSFWISLMIMIGLPIMIVASLKNNSVYFSIENNKVTINWGIFTKKSRSVLIENIQNVTLESGVLMRLFGISVLKFWTASQGQISVNKNGSITKPDGLLILKSEDAIWMNNYMTPTK